MLQLWLLVGCAPLLQLLFATVAWSRILVQVTPRVCVPPPQILSQLLHVPADHRNPSMVPTTLNEPLSM